MTQQVVEGLHQKLSLHDFRLVSGENSNRLDFLICWCRSSVIIQMEELLEMISGRAAPDGSDLFCQHYI